MEFALKFRLQDFSGGYYVDHMYPKGSCLDLRFNSNLTLYQGPGT